MTSTELLKTVLRKGQFIINVLGKYVSFNQCLFAAVFFLSAASFWLSYEIRFDFNVPQYFAGQRLLLLLYVSLLKLTFFYLLRGHGSNWRYVGISDVPNLFFHCVLCSTTLFALGYVSERLWVPRGVVLIDFFMSIVFIGGSRVGLRVLREKIRLLLRTRASGRESRAVIVGAGDAGEMIVREIARDTGSRIKIAAIFDDNPKKQGHTIHGIRVVGGVDHISAYAQDNKFDTAIIAIPSARNADMQRIHRVLKPLDIKVKTLPGLNEIIHGSAKLTQLRDITISDLLGREEINIDTELLKKLIFRKTALVTGAGGSIGSELCRQILKREPKRLILLERTENNLFHVNRQLTDVHPDIPIVPVLCDVRDRVRVEEVLEEFRPELVFHAAAHKHVHMQELNPAECVKNNIAGMQILTRACDRVRSFSFSPHFHGQGGESHERNGSYQESLRTILPGLRHDQRDEISLCSIRECAGIRRQCGPNFHGSDRPRWSNYSDSSGNATLFHDNTRSSDIGAPGGCAREFRRNHGPANG